LHASISERTVYRRGDLNPISRAIRILNALRGYPEGRPIAQLAKEVETSERTVKRDLAALADAQIKIDRTPIEGRAAARLEEESHRSVTITRRERYTLLAIRRMFDILKGTPLAEDVESLLSKLQQRATAKERAENAADRDRFAYVPDGGTKLYRGKEDVLDALQTGVLMRRVVKYTYRGARGRASRGYLAPFSMLLFKHGLYFVGRRLDDPKSGHTIPSGQPEIYAAERFVDAEHMRDHAFTVPADFRVDDLFYSAFEMHVGDPAKVKRVVIEFSKDRSSYVTAREWHKSQVLDEQSDGAVRLSFTCANFAPVVSWVHEWGPHAKVISPPELRQLVVDELREALAQYERDR
jgi:predicted DNA-binding transcriptional regulator YafY